MHQHIGGNMPINLYENTISQAQLTSAPGTMAQGCLQNLMTGPLKGQKLKVHRTDVKSGEKTVIEIGGEK